MKYTVTATKPNGEVMHLPCEDRSAAGRLVADIAMMIMVFNPGIEPVETNLDPASPDLRIDFKKPNGEQAGSIQAYPAGAN